MTEFIEWLKGIDYTAIYIALGTFVTTWGGSIIALVIGLLKQKTKTFNYQKALEKVQIELNQDQTEKIESLKKDIVAMLTDVQKNIITNNELANEERLKVIETITTDANKSLEELKSLTTDEVLKGLN
jgi:uncharacterized membrane protein